MAAISHWKYDEASGDAIDSVGDHDQDVNPASPPTTVTAILGTARDFEASTEQGFSIPSHADFLPGDTHWRWYGWFKLESEPGTYNLICQYGNFNIDILGNVLRFYINDAAYVASVTLYGPAPVLGTPVGHWFRFEAWHDPDANTINLDVNAGEFTASTSTTGTAPASASLGTYFGSFNGVQSFFDGVLDEFGFDSGGTAPTAEELSIRYNDGLGLEYPFDVQVIAISDSRILLSPYNWRLSGIYAETNNCGASIKFDFTGTSCSLRIDPTTYDGLGADAPTIAYSLDGGAWTRVLLADGQTRLGIGVELDDELHHVEIYLVATGFSDRWTTPQNIWRVTGVQIDSDAELSAPPEFASNMIVFGDSVGEGAEMLAPYTSSYPEIQDAHQAYPALLGRSLQCEVGPVSFGGTGFNATGVGGVPALPDFWDMYNATDSRLTGGLLTPEPKYIICCAGQNDQTDVTATVTALVAAWRAAAPNAMIVFCSPADENRYSEISAGVLFANDANAFSVRINEDLHRPGVAVSGAKAYSNNNHLNVRGQVRYATILVNQIKSLQVAIDSASVAAILAAIKSDADLGTAGLIADAATAAAEVGKIPRLSTAVAAGASVRRTKGAATSTTLDETLGATP